MRPTKLAVTPKVILSCALVVKKRRSVKTSAAAVCSQSNAHDRGRDGSDSGGDGDDGEDGGDGGGGGGSTDVFAQRRSLIEMTTEGGGGGSGSSSGGANGRMQS